MLRVSCTLRRRRSVPGHSVRGAARLSIVAATQSLLWHRSPPELRPDA